MTAGLRAVVEHLDGVREEITLVADAPASFGAIEVHPSEPIVLRAGDVIRPLPASLDLDDLGVHTLRFPEHVVATPVSAGDAYSFMVTLENPADDGVPGWLS